MDMILLVLFIAISEEDRIAELQSCSSPFLSNFRFGFAFPC